MRILTAADRRIGKQDSGLGARDGRRAAKFCRWLRAMALSQELQQAPNFGGRKFAGC